MLSQEIVTLETKPFSYGYIDDILLDKRLLDYFPPVEVFNKMKAKPDGYGHGKLHLNRSNKQFRPNLGPWKDFYRWISGDQFREWGREVFGIRSDGGRMEFSALGTNGGYLFPHADSPVKCLSMVIYHSGFPAPTEFGPTEEGPWTPVHWKINRANWMLKNDHSWHRVPEFEGPEGEYRNTLTLNLIRSKRKHKGNRG
ncbi:hypothetical protein [uncultured Mediterranean phage]|nr:hypothetical protein [uncultured Mediterranean phage]